MTDIKKERKVKDFSKGMIYRIVCNITGDVYIGSSVQTCAQRLSKHVDHHKRWKKDNTKVYYSAFIIIERGDYKIILVESYPCKNNDELFSREQHWIDQTECVNKKRAHSTEEQLNEHKLKYNKQYNKDNSEHIAERSKNYNILNEKHLTQKRREWKDINKDKIREPTNCICGSIFQHNNKSQHLRTQKHINFTQA